MIFSAVMDFCCLCREYNTDVRVRIAGYDVCGAGQGLHIDSVVGTVEVSWNLK